MEAKAVNKTIADIARGKSLTCIAAAFAALAAAQMAQAETCCQSETVGGNEETPCIITDTANLDGAVDPEIDLCLSVSEETDGESERPVSVGGKVWVGVAGDGKLSSAANWLDNTAPSTGDVLDFSRVNAAVSLDADLGKTVPATLLFGTNLVTISSGSLTVNTLTNASMLAIGAGASLEVVGDIVAKPLAWGEEEDFLYSNEGSVVVHGNAVGIAIGSCSVYEYKTGDANTKPMQVGGIRYDAGIHSLYFHINSAGSYYTQDSGTWVVGGNGIGFASGREHSVTHYYTQYGGSVVLRSSADWTLANSMKKNADKGEIMMSGKGSVTFDTSDYGDSTVPRTITLQGRLYANDIGMSHPAFVVDGCGTVVVDTADMSSVRGIEESLKHTFVNNSILQVKSGSTLKVNDGKKIAGANGRIALEAGATLAFASSGIADFAERIEPSVALPAEGTAKMRIGGPRLEPGDYTILSNVTGTSDHVSLDANSPALVGGRIGSLAVDGGKLVLTIR